VKYSISSLYDTVGISKQSIHQYAKRQKVFDVKVAQLVIEVDELRTCHPGCGVEKMYHTLNPSFMGRDRFIELFMDLGYRLKRSKNFHITTKSGSHYYDNLIEGLSISSPCHVWQSDITYIRIKDCFYYAVFIIDVYTRKIVGYQVSDHMRASANIQALKMALNDHQNPKIHHSDRGSQYIYSEYVKLLKEMGTQLSMGKIAQENAYAERINGTIKNEFLAFWKPSSFEQLKRQIKMAVIYCNEERPHSNLRNLSPVQFIKRLESMDNKQCEKMTIFNYSKQS
jgi:putative transposase